MKIRKATVRDIDILVKLRLDFLLADRGHLNVDEESAIRIQLGSYYAKHINHDFIAILAAYAYEITACLKWDNRYLCEKLYKGKM